MLQERCERKYRTKRISSFVLHPVTEARDSRFRQLHAAGLLNQPSGRRFFCLALDSQNVEWKR